ncbi:SRPBCC family protein [Desertimonas flava]|uniref:SRPBCC family protein n=1 Tax=Desertimonas flava TaxID=2064846 RepID=UPI000E34B0AE|nr:SRPBCC family protein [Desertimonas flava]
MTFGSVRHHVRIGRPAADVWALVGDPARLHEWFPGIDECVVEGTCRKVTLGSGLRLTEEITVADAIRRRFQYRITEAMFTYHRGTIDVLDLDDGTCVVSYATDADPRTMALTIGGGTAAALAELKRQMETTEADV